MVRKQFFITAAQSRGLKLRAAESGVAEAEIVRHGIDLALAEHAASDDGWRQGLERLSGA